MSKSVDVDQQSIEELQQRYSALNTRKIQAETNLENALKQLEQYKQQAREKYDTDDIEELQKKLEEMKAENERKRREYQSELDKIEQNLVKVDEEFAKASQQASESDESE